MFHAISNKVYYILYIFYEWTKSYYYYYKEGLCTCFVDDLECDIHPPAQWQWLWQVCCHLVCHVESCWRENVTLSWWRPDLPLHVQEARLRVVEVDPVSGHSGPVTSHMSVHCGDVDVWIMWLVWHLLVRYSFSMFIVRHRCDLPEMFTSAILYKTAANAVNWCQCALMWYCMGRVREPVKVCPGATEHICEKVTRPRLVTAATARVSVDVITIKLGQLTHK